MKNYAIIVAGGTGLRMKAGLPKQFLPVAGKPILMHTLEAFYYSSAHPELLLVLPASHLQFWSDLCRAEHFTIPHRVITGGEQRFHSVQLALSGLPDDALVAVHDAVRPLVSEAVIAASFLAAAAHGSAVTAIPSRDSVRRLRHQEASVALPREQIFLVQTPQTFRADLLKKAYEQPYDPDFTDDASVVERSGIDIHLCEGDAKNIKITFPEDLLYAGLLLQAKKTPAV